MQEQGYFLSSDEKSSFNSSLEESREGFKWPQVTAQGNACRLLAAGASGPKWRREGALDEWPGRAWVTEGTISAWKVPAWDRLSLNNYKRNT